MARSRTLREGHLSCKCSKLMMYISFGLLIVMTTLNVERFLSIRYNEPFHGEKDDRAKLVPSAQSHSLLSIEDLMYKYRSDKSRDDHGYTKLYHMIFSSVRLSVKNITEVGIAAGQSLQAWYRYFPSAEIHAFDVKWYGENAVKENLSFLPRVHPHIFDILEVKDIASLGFLPESMDIVIEDGPHTLNSQQLFLVKLFPLVKPGGYYIIEDIGHAQGGVQAFHNDPSTLQEDVRIIMESHDTIFVDTSVGHRAWDMWLNLVGGMWAQDHVKHNSYCLVIQKRLVPLPPLQINYKTGGAMNPGMIVKESGNG
ncbi:hypothetical protein HJC23_007692 [Cyclotella cryptica]|uniref:Uncharacterized protein n=1 Tax=Cyclotella cryptica TaxID=29204 RepID=A0ABD3PR70_9STRA